MSLNEVLNKAINETLSRTIMTSATVFLACICLMVFGQNTVLFDFGLIMGFGVIIGTYSSIYVAAPIFHLPSSWMSLTASVFAGHWPL